MSELLSTASNLRFTSHFYSKQISESVNNGWLDNKIVVFLLPLPNRKEEIKQKEEKIAIGILKNSF